MISQYMLGKLSFVLYVRYTGDTIYKEVAAWHTCHSYILMMPSLPSDTQKIVIDVTLLNLKWICCLCNCNILGILWQGYVVHWRNEMWIVDLIWPVCLPGLILLTQDGLWDSVSSTTQCGIGPMGLVGEGYHSNGCADKSLPYSKHLYGD